MSRALRRAQSVDGEKAPTGLLISCRVCRSFAWFTLNTPCLRTLASISKRVFCGTRPISGQFALSTALSTASSSSSSARLKRSRAWAPPSSAGPEELPPRPRRAGLVASQRRTARCTCHAAARARGSPAKVPPSPATGGAAGDARGCEVVRGPPLCPSSREFPVFSLWSSASLADSCARRSSASNALDRRSSLCRCSCASSAASCIRQSSTVL
mmetsp:Transcript_60930/g.181533  ORF Transcript_60930/g.181533 Transcript_60930/m.181533 type:complete len:213 (+) Transcript_60930:97-735(+)